MNNSVVSGFGARQSSNEARKEAYSWYVDRALELLTKPRTKRDRGVVCATDEQVVAA